MRFSLSLLLISLVSASIVSAQDKSATRGSVVSLPGPGGTVQKESSGFQVQSNTGSAGFDVPLPPLPGRGGITAKLSLNYSQFTGDIGSGFGVGWALNIPTLALDTETGTAIRFNKKDGDFYNVPLYNGEPLIMVGPDGDALKYQIKRSQSWLDIRYYKKPFTVSVLDARGQKKSVRIASGFTVKHANGTLEVFSGDPEIAEGLDAAGFVSRWPLVYSIGPQGESIEYRYKRFGGRSYVSDIFLAGGESHYAFDWIDARGSIVDYRNSYAQQNLKLYSSLKAEFRGQTIAQWCFAYMGRSLSNPAEQVIRTADACQARAREELADKIDSRSINVLDQLRAIYRFGRTITDRPDGRWPTIYLDYSSWTRDDLSNRSLVYRQDNLNFLRDKDKRAIELADIDHDSQVDIVYSSSNDQAAQVYRGRADWNSAYRNSEPWQLIAADGSSRINFSLTRPDTHFADINGDSYADLVKVYDGGFEVYLADRAGQFRKFSKNVSLKGLSPALFEGGAAQFIDMDGDGFSDILAPAVDPNGNTSVQVFRNLSLRDYKGMPYIMFDAPARLRLPTITQNTRFFAQEGVKVSDITGDGLPDLVLAKLQSLTHRPGLCIYANTGNLYDTKNFSSTQEHGLAFGEEGSTDATCGSGRFLDLEGLKPLEAQQGIRNMWNLDVNGDGLVDFASVIGTPNTLRVWLGLGNGKFMKQPLELQLNLPINVGTEASFRSRIADIDGDGQAEIMVFQAEGVAIIDFNRNQNTQLVKANLLTSIAYETGLRHDIRYTTSIDELERDRLQKLPPVPLHFPVILAKQIITSESEKDGIRQNVQTEEYLFHQPDYDAINRKFLGFARVERIFYGDNLGGRESTQASSYTVEDYVSGQDKDGVILRGRLKKQSIHAFVPHDSYRIGGGELLDTQDARIYSMSEYSRQQVLPIPGVKKQENSFEFQAAESGGTALRKTHYIRQLADARTTLEGRDRLIQKSLYRDFDSFNFPGEIRTWTSSAVEPSKNLRIPSRLLAKSISYTEARQKLSALGIVSLPDTERVHLLPSDDITTDIQGELISARGFDYDPATGRPATETESILNSAEPRTLSVIKTYDAYGNIKTVADADGLMETITWDEEGILPIRSRNALGHEIALYYGPVSGVDAPVGFLGNDRLDQVTHGQDVRGLWFFVSHDDLGRSIQFMDAAGREQRFTYKMGRNGGPSLVLTEIRRYAEKEKVPVGEERWIRSLKAHSPAGTELASVEQNEQQGVRVLSLKEYNRNLQLISEYTPYEVPSKDIETVFAEGMIPFSSSEQHRIRTFYDELGRPQRRIFHDELTEIYSYPVWGERVESTYAQLGKLDGTRTTSTKSTVRMSDTVHAVIDELGHPTIFERDAWLNLKGIHLPGEAQPRTLSFNSKGWLEAQNIPGLGRWVYAYGDRGEKILEERYDSQGQRLHSTVYVYDDLQRLTDEKVDGTVLMHMAYDAYPDRSRENILPGSLDKPIGLLTHVVKADPNSLYDFGKIQQYDAAGRLLGQEVRLGSEVFVETYSQTLDDIVTGITDPFGVRTQLSLGRSLRPIAAEVQAPWFDKPESLLEHLSYNSRGQLERIDYRAGTTSWMQYDPATLLPSHLESRGKDGQLLQKMSYIFDGKGQLLHIEDELVNPAFGLANRTADYRYNDRGELMTAERYGQVQSYDYNPAGNMTRNTEFSNDLMRSTARNTILPEGTESQPFTYDAAGQLISGRNILEARYDSHGQMIFARTARHSVFLGYSPDGKRSYRKTVPVDGAALPSVSFHPVASVIIESGSKQSFVSIGSHRLARLDHDRREWYYYLRDQVTSTELMLSSDGTPVEQVLYMPYGSELETTSLSPDWKAHEQTLGDKKPSRSTKHRFTGHYRDDDLGIYDFVARHYDPLLGRFLSPDPEFIARPERCSQSPIECNLYSYARNNPLRYVDPSGLATIIVHGTWSSNTEGNWANENSAFSRSIERHFGDRLFSLSWSGTNGSEARTEGAELLAQRIAEVQRLTGDKNINIVAHSHGGNVVKEYTNRPDAVRLNFVVNLNTPQRSDYRANMNNITKLINVYNHNDMVQINGGNGKIDTRIFESGNAGRFDFQAHLNIETPYGKMGKLDSHSISTTDGYWDRHIAPSIENPVPR